MCLYFSLFFRRIKEKFSLFLLNIIGYVILLSVISLTTLFIYGELTHDNFKKKDRIYRMVNSLDAGVKPAYSLYSSLTVTKDIKTTYPEIESLVNLFFIREMNIANSKKELNQNVIFFNGDFINTFTPDFIYGNLESFNQGSNVCFISKTFSDQLFGKNVPVGENLILANKDDTIQVTIEGVIKDFQNTTCMLGDVFVKGEVRYEFYDDISDLSFILLKENGKIDKLNHLQPNEYEYNGIKYKESFFFQSIREVYFKSGFLDFNFYPSGNLKLLYILIVALLLMLLSIIFNYNFMFIILTRARIKEFSIKRVLGIDKRSVLLGIIADSVLFVFVAACFSYPICKIAVYSIQNLNSVLENYFQWFEVIYIIVFSSILIITAIIPLIYYKTILKFRRLDRLKYNNEAKRKKMFGIIFLGVQIIVAFVLLGFSFTMKSQLRYAVNRNLGINNRNLIIMKNHLSEQDYQVLSEELKKTTTVSDVTRIGKLPPSNFPQAMTRVRCKIDEEKEVLTAMMFVDRNTLETIGVKYTMGEGFQNYSDYESDCVISQSLADQLGVDNIIGYEVKSGKRIIGVVEDISMVPVRKDNFPLLIQCKPEICKEILVSYTTQDDAAVVQNIINVYKYALGEDPVLTFYDEHLKMLYKEENFMLSYIVSFSTLTLLMVFLGFYFYSRSIVDLRSREIVIRKIHGASVADILRLLLKEYSIVLLVSVIFSCFLCSYISGIWLSGFAFHIENSLKHYLYPTVLIVVILLIAVLNSVLILAHKNIVVTMNNYQ